MKKMYKQTLLALAAILVASTSWAQTYYVNATTGSNANTVSDAQNPATPWQTIQHAVTNANSGATISVAAGTYSENVVVNKSLTLRGARFATVGTDVTRGTSESVVASAVNDPATAILFSIEANNVTIEGFLFNGDLGGNQASAAIQTTGAANRTNIDVTNNVITTFAGYGVKLFNPASGSTSGHAITGNLFTGIIDQTVGTSALLLSANDRSTAVVLERNVFASVTNNSFILVGNGVITRDINTAGTGSISNNVFELISVTSGTTDLIGGAGIFNVRHYNGNYTVSNNNISAHATQTGRAFVAIYGNTINGKRVDYSNNTMVGQGDFHPDKTYSDATSVGFTNIYNYGYYLHNCAPVGTDTLTITGDNISKFFRGFSIVDRTDTLSSLAPVLAGNQQPTRNHGYKLTNVTITESSEFGVAAYQQGVFASSPNTTWPNTAFTYTVNMQGCTVTETFGGRTDRAAIAALNFAVTDAPTARLASYETSGISLIVNACTLSDNRRSVFQLRAARSVKVTNTVMEGNGWNPGGNSRGAVFNIVSTNGGTFRTMGGLIEGYNNKIARASVNHDPSFASAGLRPVVVTTQPQVGRIELDLRPATYAIPYVVLNDNSIDGFTNTGNNGPFFNDQGLIATSPEWRINASRNWWGSDVTATVTSSLGNTAVIDVTPFLTSGTDASVNPGFQPTPNYKVISTAAQSGAFAFPTLSATGQITALVNVFPGSSYDPLTPPTVSITTAGGGSGANYSATVAGNGRVSSYTGAVGSAYGSSGTNRKPRVVVSAPERLKEAIDLLPASGGTLTIEGSYASENITTNKNFTISAPTAATVGAITLTGSGSLALLSGSNLTVAGNLTKGSGGEINISGTNTLIVQGELLSSLTNYTWGANSTLQLSSGSVPTSSSELGTLRVNGPLSLSGMLNVGNVDFINATGLISIGTRHLMVGGVTYTAAGTFSGTANSSFTVTGGSPTLNFTTGAQMVANLTVQAGTPSLGTNLTVERNLTLDGTLNPGANQLTIGSDANLFASVNNPLVGNTNVKVRQGVDGQFRWMLLGTSVTGQTLQNWVNNTEAGVNGIDIRLAQGAPLNASAVFFTGGSTWTDATALTNPVTPGTGVRVLARQPFIDTDQQGNGLGVLSNVGSVVVGAAANGNPANNFSFPGLTSAGLRWNLVANPYPAVINFDTAGWVKTDVENTVWTWNTTNYQTYNATTNTSLNGGSPYIAKGQGFFVRATVGGTPVLEVNESAKTVVTKSLVRRAAPSNISRLRLEMRNSAMSNADEAAIVLIDGATMALDNNMDAAKLSGQNHTIATMANTGNALAINSIASQSNLAANTVVPVRVTANTLGNYSIAFTEFLNLDNVQMYLVDKFLGTITNIAPGTVYDFSITANPLTQGNGRFEINFSPASVTNVALNAAQPQFTVYPNPAVSASNVSISLGGFDMGANVAISVYDVQGKLVHATTTVVNSLNSVEQLNAPLAAGMYNVVVTSNNVNLTQKLVINK